MKKLNTLLLLLLSSFIFSCQASKTDVLITNFSKKDKKFEDVEISWQKVITINPEITEKNLIILLDGKQQTYQINYKNDKPNSVLFQASVEAGKSLKYKLKTGIPQKFEAKVFGRLVPERKDDFAWENNIIAYRMYGPALAATGEISNGIDPWSKRTSNLIINKWYRINDYHKDSGEGLDAYKVGRTLGAGALAPLFNDSLVLGSNFVKSEVLENGPLRVKFRLTYDSLIVGGIKVKETRTISLSANSYFNKCKHTFEGDYTSLPAAVGIVQRPKKGEIGVYKNIGFVTYEEPLHHKNGQMRLGVILGDKLDSHRVKENHLQALTTIKNKTPYVYYFGNSWNKSGVETFASWVEIASDFACQLQEPLSVTIK